jgi:hypothetical protein
MNVSDIMVNREEESKMITQDSAEYVKNNLGMFMVPSSSMKSAQVTDPYLV